MNVSFNIKPTETITLDDGTTVRVSSLPEIIRYEVETLDRFMQKKLEIVQELEIIELAILAKKSQINNLAKPKVDKTEE